MEKVTEFLKKNWIWILVAVIIIVALLYFFKKPERLGKATFGRAFTPGQVGNESAISDIKTIIKLGVTSLADLKQKALAKGYHVMSKEDAAVAKMTPDPKRVVVSYVISPCLPGLKCPPAINIISVG
jgi:hypothetical protein